MAPWPYMALQPKLAPPDDNEMSANLAHKSSCFSATVFYVRQMGAETLSFLPKTGGGHYTPIVPSPPTWVGSPSRSQGPGYAPDPWRAPPWLPGRYRR